MHLSSSSLTGNKVKNGRGEDLGDVKDFMIDTDSGQVDYAVLSFGGFLGVGDKYFAIPLQAMTLDTNDECFRLNVEEEKLKDAPGFDKDHWPNTADTKWHRQIHEYYGVLPSRKLY